MKRNLMMLVAGLLATSLIAAGCGDDDDDGGDDTTSAALSKEEFVAQANEICKTGNAEINAAGEEAFGQAQQEPSGEELDAFVKDTLVPSVQGQIDDIRALGIPEGDEATVNGFLDEAEDQLDELERDPQAVSGDPFAEVNKDLSAYGLTTCAN